MGNSDIGISYGRPFNRFRQHLIPATDQDR